MITRVYYVSRGHALYLPAVFSICAAEASTTCLHYFPWKILVHELFLPVYHYQKAEKTNLMFLLDLKKKSVFPQFIAGIYYGTHCSCVENSASISSLSWDPLANPFRSLNQLLTVPD